MEPTATVAPISLAAAATDDNLNSRADLTPVELFLQAIKEFQTNVTHWDLEQLSTIASSDGALVKIRLALRCFNA